MSTQQKQEPAVFEVENVGGITATEQSIPSGVTVLTGENATNRTSFLQAVMAAVGSDRASLKADADSGMVTLTIDGETYTRELTGSNGRVRFDGEPYLDETTEADLFAFLLEDNKARQAVAGGESLRERIMEPVDTEAIEAAIERLENERQEIDAELERLDGLADRLPDLEARQRDLEEQLQNTEEELASRREELEEREQGVEENQARKQTVEEKLEELKQLESQRDRKRRRVESEQESLAALRTEREEIEADMEELTEPADSDPEELAQRLERLRTQKATVESTISRLEQIIQFNEDVLSGDSTGVGDLDITTAGADDNPTEQLLEDTVQCWTCGTEVEKTRIETTLEELRDLRADHVTQRTDVAESIDDVNDTKRRVEQQRRKRDDLEQRRRRVTDEIEDREATIETLSAEIEELEADIGELKTEIDDLETAVRGEVLELHSTVNQLEFERDQREEELEEVREEIASIEAELDARENLEAEREGITEELAERRTRIEQIEREAVEAFNSHMETVLEVLDYENIARIWLERMEAEDPGRGKQATTTFDLHVVRETDDGIVYEDTVEHLSESEREVTGLVFALAGYLVHDLHETVPFMLLDSLEAVDASRIAALVEYFSEYCTYLVVALLPEDAAALDDSYTRITEI
jgi:predicted  nucleic acid-binding Zn-ribbon protein